MPPNVGKDRYCYYWRKGNDYKRLCDASASQAEVWQAYDEFLKGSVYDFACLVADYCRSAHFIGLAANTQRDYTKASKLVLKAFGQMLPDSIKPPHIRKYMDLRGQKSKKRANAERSFMLAVYAWGLERGYCLDNPARPVKPYSLKPRTKYVSDEEYMTLYNACPAPIQVAMELAYLCAMRQQDVLSLRWEQVLERGIDVTQGKTGKRQIKLFSDRLRHAIDQGKTLTGQPSAYVVCNRTGGRYTADGFNSVFYRLKQKAGSDFTFHDLKAKGISDYEGDKQEFSGHASETLMRRVYDRKPHEVKVLQ